MAKVLVVINPFQGYAKGDRIASPSQITEILAGEHAHHVVQAEHADVIPDDQE